MSNLRARLVALAGGEKNADVTGVWMDHVLAMIDRCAHEINALKSDCTSSYEQGYDHALRDVLALVVGPATQCQTGSDRDLLARPARAELNTSLPNSRWDPDRIVVGRALVEAIDALAARIPQAR
ncbi:MAG: hypothetical protein WCD38_11720 [Candidatus Tumulicola sp.]